MAGATKLMTPGGGGVNLTPASSIASDVTVNVPSVNCTLLSNKTAGTVLQVVQGTKGGTISTTSGTPVTTNLTVSITPTSASNKILVFTSAPFRKAASSVAGPSVYIFRDSTNVYTGVYNEFYNISSQASAVVSLSYLDSPSTTSAITYSLRFNSSDGSNTQYMNPDNETAIIIAMEIAA